MEVNHQTQKKIEEVKDLIAKNTDIKDIIRLKFTSKKKKDDWLSKQHIHFTNSELEYLEYKEVVDILVEDLEEQQTTLPLNNNFLNVNIGTLTNEEKTNLLLNNDTLAILQKIAQSYIMNTDTSKDIKINIDTKYFKLKDIKIKNCRISDAIYSNFIEYAKTHDITITALLNYVLDDFIKKHK